MSQERQINTIRENHPFFDKSMFVFSSGNKLRVWVHKVYHARPGGEHEYNDQHSNVLGAFSVHRLKKYSRTQTYLEWIMIFITQASILGTSSLLVMNLLPNLISGVPDPLAEIPLI